MQRRIRSSVAAAVTTSAATALAALAPLAVPAAPARADGDAAREAPDLGVPDIPFTRKVLANGLTVVIHEDHKAPVVAVNVWYHVGSKNERPGRTGFAHLFEHLMFNGSEHANDDWFRAMARFGATSVNGTTNEDRTNYFETVPTGALDATLWLESDRMGHLLGAIDQAKLDEQRGVVQNEKRQGENRPYSAADRLLPSLLYPAGHPYSWSVIGSMEDLDAASVDDVKEWFRAYYGAANAVVVLAGDVDTADALRKVERYFGDIPGGPPVSRPERWIAKRTGTMRVSVAERVPAARVEMVWNTPEWGARDAHLLDLAADVLARGEGSRFHARLVRKDALATDVSARQESSEIGGAFVVSATAARGADVAAVEAALRDELRLLADFGPTAEELATEVSQARAQFLRRIERVGGFGGRSAVLAGSELFGGRPDAWKDRFAVLASATPKDVQDAATRWLSDGVLVLTTLPAGRHVASKEGADRSSMPPVAEPPEAAFPALVRSELPNGLRVILARRAESPLVRLDLLVDAGFTADAPSAPGVARLAASLLTAGTATRSAAQIRSDGDRLGADFEVATETDTTRVSLSVPQDGLAAAFGLLADVALRPAFPAHEIEVMRRGQLAAIEQEKSDARGVVQRLLPRMLFGDGSPWSAPSSGTGSAAAVAKATRDDLVQFHAAWFRPASATLVVTGDVAPDALQPLVVQAFGAWAPGRAPAKSPPAAVAANASRIYLIDRPGAPQSSLIAAQLVPARGGASDLPIAVANTILGGSFISRINMNLREDKHWSYGARSEVRDVRGPRPFVMSAQVQTDRTAESMTEMLKELRGIAGAVLPTADEIAAAKSSMTLTLPGRWDASRAVSESIAEIVTFGLPDTWFDGYAARIRAVTAGQAAEAGCAITPDRVVWIVVGDRRKVEAGVRALAIGEVVVVDTVE